MAQTYRKAVDDDLDWQQRLANYSSNKDAGLSEYQRALEVYRGKSAAGDTAGAEAAKKWSDQVNTAIGGIGSNKNSQVNNTLDTIGQKVNSQPFQFKQTVAAFNPQNIQTDPAYQALLKQAQANITSGQNNTLANLAARGQGNSSYATTVAQKIANNEMSNVSNNLLPKLMEQYYARYQNEVNNDYRTQLANYQAQQDQLGNLNKYAGTLSDLEQRDLDNQQRTADNAFRDSQAAQQQKQANWNAYLQSVGLTGDLGTGPKSDYSLLGDTSGNLSLAGLQRQDNLKQQGIENTRADKQLNATLANMGSDNARAAAAEARAAGNQQLGALFDIWDRTGVAPAGIPGVQAGTPLRKSSTSSGGFNLDDYKGYINQNFYVDTPDPNNYGKTVKSFDAGGARKYIIGMGLSDDQTDQLLKLYNLPTN